MARTDTQIQQANLTEEILLNKNQNAIPVYCEHGHGPFYLCLKCGLYFEGVRCPKCNEIYNISHEILFYEENLGTFGYMKRIIIRFIRKVFC